MRVNPVPSESNKLGYFGVCTFVLHFRKGIRATHDGRKESSEPVVFAMGGGEGNSNLGTWSSFTAPMAFFFSSSYHLASSGPPSSQELGVERTELCCVQ